MKNFQLEQFSGPLDLLLSLIDEEKMDISEISLSTVTEQYLNYLNQIENRKPEELADFLLIAARLLLLKSKKLLPQLDSEEEEGGSSLEEQLRLYKVFVEASRKIHQAWQENQRAVFRIEPLRRPEKFIPPGNLALEAMKESLVKLLQRIQPLKPLLQAHIDKTVSLEEKINQIRALLSGGAVNFSAVLRDSQNRTEVIIGFLALLELVKQKAVFLKQKQSFNDIVIEKI